FESRFFSSLRSIPRSADARDRRWRCESACGLLKQNNVASIRTCPHSGHESTPGRSTRAISRTAAARSIAYNQTEGCEQGIKSSVRCGNGFGTALSEGNVTNTDGCGSAARHLQHLGADVGCYDHALRRN